MTQQDPRIEAAARAIYARRYLSAEAWGIASPEVKASVIADAAVAAAAIDEVAMRNPRVEVVAAALYKADHRGDSDWSPVYSAEQEQYRRMAEHALAALDKLDEAKS